MADYIGAVDQGTTSSRFIIFNRAGEVVSIAQQEHEQIYPKPGWVEHNPEEIWRRTESVISSAMGAARLKPSDLAAIGITNQRETTVVWNKKTGKPVYNAIVWQDTRVADDVAEFSKLRGQDRYRAKTGLPLSCYFSALKIRWILNNVPGIHEQAESGQVLCGTIDSFLIWKFTGGPNGGLHVTDVTNASRTQLMDLATAQWEESILSDFEIPAQMLPKIVSSSEVFGHATIAAIQGVAIAGVLGDQQAALVGQTCLNTGTRPVLSTSGLLTTVAYRLGAKPTHYALEGSIAITGALVQWLRDNFGLIQTSADVEPLARTVEDNGGVYFVPAFSGLYAPYWKDNARGVIAGLTRYANKGHIARAALEATAFQVREVVEAMAQDSGVNPDVLRVDGGMVTNELLMQFQADILGLPVVRPKVAETTALGAAYAAGLAVGFFTSTEELVANWAMDHRWEPNMDDRKRKHIYRFWKKAVARSFDWAE